MEPIIRDGTAKDAAVIAEIYNQSMAVGDATMDEQPKTADDFAGRIDALNPRERMLVLELEGKIIGWGLIQKYSPRSGYRHACEVSVYLDRNHLRRGYGSLLKKAQFQFCRQHGYHHLVSKVLEPNHASIAANQNLGFEIVGIQKEIGYLNGKWIDMVIMQKILRDVEPL